MTPWIWLLSTDHSVMIQIYIVWDRCIWSVESRDGGMNMINFDEEIKRFKPALELDQAEDAIYNNDLKDIMDVMQEMMRVAKEAEK